MNEFEKQAVKRLNDEAKSGKFDKYGAAMKLAVKDALIEFSRQDDEFAQAIVQGGSFDDCMKAVSKRVKNSCISDLDAYAAAAEFYFPGSKIRFEMRIELCEHEEAPKSPVLIDLTAFL